MLNFDPLRITVEYLSRILPYNPGEIGRPVEKFVQYYQNYKSIHPGFCFLAFKAGVLGGGFFEV
jgi:hypothetical protein